VHSFTAGADYRMYAATMTGCSGGSTDTPRDVIASEGTTVLEADDDSGGIAGAIRPYDFYLRVLSGSPIPETEPNDEGAPQAPRSNGGMSRVIGPATAKNDSFAITVNGEDTIGVIVAVDLERGAPVWNVIAGTGVFTGSFVITL
jgi:hypothetical protein